MLIDTIGLHNSSIIKITEYSHYLGVGNNKGVLRSMYKL
ncbi:hypothetical protein IE9_05166 [Bacillus cereus BAG4X12-1]|nr:hypothetical protein IE9_05324 [Bacillus cereus BAG4X12-1]EJQ22878.1 hypothetical protein IE9_05166 [Bacillus cereus BAG4X12-1]EOP78309.1 hypothetical protein IEG_05193 [Bacillus cereus BAG5X12-1]